MNNCSVALYFAFDLERERKLSSVLSTKQGTKLCLPTCHLVPNAVEPLNKECFVLSKECISINAIVKRPTVRGFTVVGSTKGHKV